MPRGGPDASCLDRLLQTDRQEYLDRDDVDPRVKRSVIRALDWTGEVFGNHDRFAAIVLDEVADVADPRILELGAGHGGLSRQTTGVASERAGDGHRHRTRVGRRDRRR